MPRHKARMSVGGNAVHNFTVAHVQDAMAVRGCFRVVRDHDDRLAEFLVELTQERENIFGTLRVEISGGLVCQDNLGFADDGARNRDTLLLAAGKLRRPMMKAVAQAEKFDGQLEAMGIKAVTVNVLGERDIVIGVEGGEQVETLKDEADFVAAKKGTGRIGHGGQIVAVEQDASAGGLREAANDVQHGGFPASRGAHDGNKFGRENFDVDAAEGGNIHFAGAINFPEIFCFKYGLQHRLQFERLRFGDSLF